MNKSEIDLPYHSNSNSTPTASQTTPTDRPKGLRRSPLVKAYITSMVRAAVLQRFHQRGRALGRWVAGGEVRNQAFAPVPLQVFEQESNAGVHFICGAGPQSGAGPPGPVLRERAGVDAGRRTGVLPHEFG